MGLSASQCRLLLLTQEKNDLEFRAQQISQKRLLLSQQLEGVAREYENATSNRQMKIMLSDKTGGETISKNVNLTYSALMSGTWRNVSQDDSGLVSQDPGSLENLKNYRLVDYSGAIVVASYDEVPGMQSKDVTHSKDAEKLDIKGLEDSSAGKVYKTVTSKTRYENGERVKDNDDKEEINYFITIPTAKELLPKKDASGEPVIDADGNVVYEEQDNDLKRAMDTFYQLNESGIPEVKLSNNSKYIEYEGQVFDLTTGKRLQDGDVDVNNDGNIDKNDITSISSIKFDKSAKITNDISQCKSVETRTEVTNTNKDDGGKTGNDGKYHVTVNGVERTYVVDKSLAAGTTESQGATSGPNYLQDCLRNGKYLIQHGSKSIDTNKFEWHSVSWDSTSNISDSYYADDDDSAKAKYDRLQTQIQAQDKKLEMELDQVETQRNAVNTEIESVQKVEKENIEKTFKPFTA